MKLFRQELSVDTVLLCSGVLMLAGLFFNANYFYFERLYGDAAFYLFKIVNNNSFNIEHGRPVAVLMQFIPVYLVDRHASLVEIIKWFSRNEWIFYFTCFLILCFLFRDIKAATGFLFAFVCGSRFNYFNPVSELILAIPFVFMFYSLIIRETITFIQFLAALAIGILIIYCHPLYFIFIPAVLILAWVYRQEKYEFGFLVITAVIMIVNVVHYLQLDHYESETMQQSLSFPLEAVLNFEYGDYFSYIFPLFTGWMVLLILCIYFLARAEKKIRLIYFILVVAALWGMVMYKFGSLYSERFEPFERFFILVPVFVCLVFFNHVSPLVSKKLLTVLLFILPVYHLYKTYEYGSALKMRTAHIFRVIDYARQFPEDKISFRGRNFFPYRYGQDYFLLNESLLFSSIIDPEQTKQITIVEGHRIEFLEQAEQASFIFAPGSEWQESVTHLNPEYFKMEPSPVRFANTDSLQENLPEEFFQKFKCDLLEPQPLKHKTKGLALIRIANQSGSPLFSGQNSDGITLSYRWAGSTDEANLQNHNPFTSTIVGDIFTTLEQEINIKTPKVKGDFQLQVLVTFKNGRQVPLGKSLAVKIN